MSFLSFLADAERCIAIWTGLSRHLDDAVPAIIGKTGNYWKSLDAGSATTVVAAFDPSLNKSPDVYLSDCHIAEAAPHASDPSAAERLWKLSERLVGEDFVL